MEHNSLDIASLVAQESDSKIVFSVGSVYHKIFSHFTKNQRFTKIHETSHKNIFEDVDFPKNSDNTFVNRYLSVWRDEKYDIIYFNTYAPSSNKLPSEKFDLIVKKLMGIANKPP